MARWGPGGKQAVVMGVLLGSWAAATAQFESSLGRSGDRSIGTAFHQRVDRDPPNATRARMLAVARPCVDCPGPQVKYMGGAAAAAAARHHDVLNSEARKESEPRGRVSTYTRIPLTFERPIPTPTGAAMAQRLPIQPPAGPIAPFDFEAAQRLREERARQMLAAEEVRRRKRPYTVHASTATQSPH